MEFRRYVWSYKNGRDDLEIMPVDLRNFFVLISNSNVCELSIFAMIFDTPKGEEGAKTVTRATE